MLFQNRKNEKSLEDGLLVGIMLVLTIAMIKFDPFGHFERASGYEGYGIAILYSFPWLATLFVMTVLQVLKFLFGWVVHTRVIFLFIYCPVLFLTLLFLVPNEESKRKKLEETLELMKKTNAVHEIAKQQCRDKGLDGYYQCSFFEPDYIYYCVDKVDAPKQICGRVKK